MNQKKRALALLGGALLVAGGLGLAVWSADRSAKAQKQLDAMAAKFYDFDDAQVTSMRVTIKGSTTDLERTDGGWELTSPIHAPAEMSVLNPMFDRLRSLRARSRVDASPSDLSTYGLEKPYAEIVAKGPRLDIDLLLGGATGFNNSEYAKKAGDPAVYLIEGNNDALEQTARTLRGKWVHLFNAREAIALEVRTPLGESVYRKTSGAWQEAAPETKPVELVAVGTILDGLAALHAGSVPAENATDLAQYGLAPATYQATVTLPTGSITDVFGAPAGREKHRLYAMTSDSTAVFQLSPGSIDFLKQPP